MLFLDFYYLTNVGGSSVYPILDIRILQKFTIFTCILLTMTVFCSRYLLPDKTVSFSRYLYPLNLDLILLWIPVSFRTRLYPSLFPLFSQTGLYPSIFPVSSQTGLYPSSNSCILSNLDCILRFNMFISFLLW
jgi:hypothetical protein